MVGEMSIQEVLGTAERYAKEKNSLKCPPSSTVSFTQDTDLSNRIRITGFVNDSGNGNGRNNTLVLYIGRSPCCQDKNYT